MALLGLRYETDEIYEQEEEVVEGTEQRRACHKSVAFIAACLPAWQGSLAAFKPAHNLSLSVALDQNQ